jgi:hypothetical protein
MPKKISTEDFIEKSKFLFVNKFSYEKTVYKNCESKLTLTCIQHGDFLVKPVYHLHNNIGCPICSGHKLNLQIFLERAKNMHGALFDYNKAVYKNYFEEVIIICKIHGEFNQTPIHHLGGDKCKRCSPSFKKDKEDFINEANKIYNNFYDYSKINYVNSNTKVEIICPEHKNFWVKPKSHLYHKCKKCALEDSKYTLEEFSKLANQIHKNKYTYLSLIRNSGQRLFIEIQCDTHGIFKTSSTDHLNGVGCPTCIHRISKGEIEWLDSVKNINLVRNKLLMINNTRYYPDAYDPETNTVYEFYGDY